MQLSCHEFCLRGLPRITVRGQTVQGGGVLLRKAPLRSSAVSWSSKRPCGPLVFRRATEGSRVLRKVWGVKRGKKTLVVFPLLPPAVGTAFPRPPKAAIAHAHFERKVASTGCAAVSAEGIPSADGKKRDRLRRLWRFSLYLTKKLPRRSLFSLKFRLHY